MEVMLMVALALIAAYAVFRPFMPRGTVEYDWDGTGSQARLAARTAEVDAEVLRYREALRSGTICTKCRQANPPGSRYCGDCGRELQNTPPEPAAAQATT